jgi:2-dehydropantoate 2-reductase
MKVLIVGCGGIGGYFGGRLVEAGADIEFLVRPNRAQSLATNGLIIRSCRGDAKLDVRTLTKDDLSGPYDLIILTCKSYDLDACIEDIQHIIGTTTLILPLLNGLQHIDKLQSRFGVARVLHGYCNISAGLDALGQVQHYNAIHELSFGRDVVPELLTELEEVTALLKSASFNARVAKDIKQELWEKFVFINALAGLTTLMRGDVGSILATNHGTEVVTAMIEECQLVAEKAGYKVGRRADKIARHAMLQPGSTFSASMFKDMMAHKKVEADALIGDMVARAQQLGVSTPLLKTAYCQLQTYQQQLNLKEAA